MSAGAADQHDVALLGDEAATGEIAHQAFVDWGVLKHEAVDILGERQLGDRQLVLDRARLLLRDLGLEQIAREALRFMPTFEGGRDDLVVSVVHPKEPELAHQIEDFGSLHGHVLLS